MNNHPKNVVYHIYLNVYASHQIKLHVVVLLEICYSSFSVYLPNTFICNRIQKSTLSFGMSSFGRVFGAQSMSLLGSL